jgi:hypothetical protein
MSADALRQLVASHTEGRRFGLAGEPRVNVLKPNNQMGMATLERRPTIHKISSLWSFGLFAAMT